MYLRVSAVGKITSAYLQQLPVRVTSHHVRHHNERFMQFITNSGSIQQYSVPENLHLVLLRLTEGFVCSELDQNLPWTFNKRMPIDCQAIITIDTVTPLMRNKKSGDRSGEKRKRKR